jgi:hypothetical protein
MMTPYNFHLPFKAEIILLPLIVGHIIRSYKREWTQTTTILLGINHAFLSVGVVFMEIVYLNKGVKECKKAFISTILFFIQVI